MTNCSSGLLKFELFDRTEFNDEELVVMKIIKSFLKSHLIQCGSYGSCFGYLILNLFINYKTGNYSLFKLTYLLQNIIPQWIEEFVESHKLVVDVDFNNLKQLSILKWRSDKLLDLSQYEVEHMTMLSLKLLCDILPKMSKNRFGARNDFIYHHINGDNVRVSDSRVVNGLYFNMPFPHIIKSRKKQDLTNVKVVLLKESVYIEAKKMEEYSESNIGATVKLVPQKTTSKEFISKLRDCIKEWKKLGIQLVVSQKVIEKSVQLILANEGILCLERISVFNFENFKKISGCTPLSSIFTELTNSEIGSLTSVSEVEIGGRR
ncbi:McKusick-Kaufman/Bardet-Biedl syndromes chaperonin [Naegleria gruberi]|uniref:McKusick-Kaufman/Bardet-Biedl syndromes chaperonin n=1 Tax=Naegleria gruberi TaxID=5762 RepID=D2VKD1_NAEGR|nr:McKusick-Kaufman/Bardet-Biedl syndromes chaperonin [Naegleria gruberi]EFC42664.1 McKusick-Kaufman/Bardet-Biedl syndromes chaperonin [Naegleria gruberi]|eukprot:XP_002675408.1 McKusick-Kaufman/Bardet-Biedl syndromes chaperonin [Naegleria gruberi strain NEG-M]